jgi:glycosyltransferase involved in cell wall biosynthesis
MRIAVNTRFLLSNYMEGYGNYLYEIFIRVVKSHPEHEFIFIFDRPYDKKFMFAPNVTGIVAGRAARHPLLWKYWYDIIIPRILKKYKADIFVSADGFCSLTTNIPQCLVVHDLAFIHYPKFISASYRFFYKRYTGKFLKKAAKVITVSDFSKHDIETHFPFVKDKISVVTNAAKKIFRPLDMDARQAVKDQYCSGSEYFITTGSIHPRKNLTNLLKAFSVFKKKQKSNTKLMIVGRPAWQYESFMKSLATYKYRDDVILMGFVSDEVLAKITAAAYAMIYPSYWEGFGVPVLEAMQSAVPVITSQDSAMQEVCGDAALYADPSVYETIAEQMMLIYKDEKMRAVLSERGLKRATQYSWDSSADRFLSFLASSE